MLTTMRMVAAVLICSSLPCFGQEFGNENGLYFEVPGESDSANENFFNQDNRIYTPGKTFVFSYDIFKLGDTLSVNVNEVNDPKTPTWKFVNTHEEDSLTIKFLTIEIQDGHGGMDDLFPDYRQTIMSQQYFSANRSLLFEGSTGLIENSKNIWIHPFRGKYFSVLQFSPYPFVKLPIEEVSSWTWKLQGISERWSDARIVEYQSKQEATYAYKVTGKKTLTTRFGQLNCTVIHATARLAIGSSNLTAYFNDQYGFVRMEYNNIDGSAITLELVEVQLE